MSSLITNATIQIRKDTAGNWTSNNPTPAAGEWCLETDTGYIKIGDGPTAWTSLGYTFGATSATVSKYDTGWIANSDWTNAALLVVHSLTANLTDLIIKFFVSSDGTEANAIEIGYAESTSTPDIGYGIEYADSDTITIRTGNNGLLYLNSSGVSTLLGAATAFYYKVKVYKLA